MSSQIEASAEAPEPMSQEQYERYLEERSKRRERLQGASGDLMSAQLNGSLAFEDEEGMPKRHPPELVAAIIESTRRHRDPYAAWKALQGQGHKVGRRTVSDLRPQQGRRAVERLREAIPKEVRDRVAAAYEQVAAENNRVGR